MQAFHNPGKLRCLQTPTRRDLPPHVLLTIDDSDQLGESRVPLSLSPCTGISRVPNPEIPRSGATCPVNRSTVPIKSVNRCSRFQGYGSHASSNTEGRYLDGDWTCWCRRVKSLAPSLRSKGYRVSVWDLTAVGCPFSTRRCNCSIHVVLPLFYKQLNKRLFK
jgi:hypothetical protein